MQIHTLRSHAHLIEFVHNSCHTVHVVSGDDPVMGFVWVV